MKESARHERWVDGRSWALQDFATRSNNVLGNDVSDAAARELIDCLEEAGVQTLLLKGPVLARLLYLPGEARGYFDVDVLVAPTAVSRAGETLARLGYQNRSEASGVDNFLGVVHAETWVRPQAAAIDLHWRLAGCAAPPLKVWRELQAGRTTIEFRGDSVAVPGRDALALHTALHAAGHGVEGLKALGDLTRALERWSMEDWVAAARLAETLQATPAFAAGLRLLPRGAVMARELALPPTPDLNWMIIHRDMRPRGTFHFSALVEATGWRTRMQILRRSLFPRRAWLVRQFPWAGRGGLALVSGYAAHLLRAPLWAVRAWRFGRLAERAE